MAGNESERQKCLREIFMEFSLFPGSVYCGVDHAKEGGSWLVICVAAVCGDGRIRLHKIFHKRTREKTNGS